MTKEEPKSESEESNRMWASASFVGVLIVIGLPLWWKTTEVYRVSLPHDKISSFDSLQHRVTTELTVVANDEATATEISRHIEEAFQNSDILKLNITKAVLSDAVHYSLDTVAEDTDALEDVAGIFNPGHNTVLVLQRKPLFQDVWLGSERIVFFRDAKAANTLVEVLDKWVYQTAALVGARADAADTARRTRLPPSDYHVVLSVVHPRPDLMDVRFDAKEAVEDYIGSFVDELSDLHNFTLKSQWIHLLDFDFQAKEVKDKSEWGRHWAVRQSRLPLLLTALEERAATRVSDLPTANFALYAVPCERAPLVIYDHDEKVPSRVQAFMSPKWGGVVLASADAQECARARPELRPPVRVVMGVFLAQLRTLIGIGDTERIEGAHVEALRSVSPRRWEIDHLLRLRALEHLTAAERTLQSLAQLLGEISNIVINDEVGASINSCVEHIERCGERLAAGDLLEAYRVSVEAARAAETAFMEPSLLALLYFPDDQKYAIYIPLFLPIMFPVILSLKNLLLWFRGKPLDKEKTE